MKCYCLVDLKVTSHKDTYFCYSCENRKCKHCSNWFVFKRQSYIFIKIGKLDQYQSYGIVCTNENDIVSVKDIVVNYDMMQKILKFHSMNEVKEYYENYAIFK